MTELLSLLPLCVNVGNNNEEMVHGINMQLISNPGSYRIDRQLKYFLGLNVGKVFFILHLNHPLKTPVKRLKVKECEYQVSRIECGINLLISVDYHDARETCYYLTNDPSIAALVEQIKQQGMAAGCLEAAKVGLLKDTRLLTPEALSHNINRHKMVAPCEWWDDWKRKDPRGENFYNKHLYPKFQTLFSTLLEALAPLQPTLKRPLRIVDIGGGEGILLFSLLQVAHSKGMIWSSKSRHIV